MQPAMKWKDQPEKSSWLCIVSPCWLEADLTSDQTIRVELILEFQITESIDPYTMSFVGLHWLLHQMFLKVNNLQSSNVYKESFYKARKYYNYMAEI